MFAELEARGVRFDFEQLPLEKAQALSTQDGSMRVGVPTEIKEDEYRVALTPAGRARAAPSTATRS